jgi:hypothetical protein
MVAGGYEAAYGDVNLDMLLGADQLDRLEILEEECIGGVFDATNADPVQLQQPVLETEPWPQLLEDNSPVNQTYASPLLIMQGEDDAIVPKGLTDSLVSELCADGVDVEYDVYPATGHGQEIAQNFQTALDWIADRFAGEPAPNNCA